MEKNYPIVISEGLEAITVIDNYIWGILNGSNALVKISLNTWKIEFISYIPVKNSLYTFANLFIDENKLYLIPRNADEIVIYDILNCTFSSIELDEEYKTRKDFLLYHSAKYKRFLYIFPHTYDAIVKLDLDTNLIEYIKNPVCDLRMNSSKSTGVDNFVCLSRQNDYIYMGGGYQSGRIVEYNLRNDSYNIIDVEGLQGKEIGFVYKTEKQYYLNSYIDKKTYTYNKNNELLQINELDKFTIFHTIMDDKDVLIFNHNGGKNSVAKIKYNGEIYFAEGIDDAIMAVEDYGDYVIAINSICAIAYVINKRDLSFVKHYISYANEETENIIENIPKSNIQEGEMNLKDYIKYVSNI